MAAGSASASARISAASGTVDPSRSAASVTQREKLLEWFNNSGLEIASLKASEIREALEGDDLPPAHRFLLELRLEGSKSSGAKYRRGLECVGPDGRIRDTMLYAGANRTGRWSGRNFQPQNLPRPSGRWETIDKDNPEGVTVADQPKNEIVIKDMEEVQGVLTDLTDQIAERDTKITELNNKITALENDVARLGGKPTKTEPREDPTLDKSNLSTNEQNAAKNAAALRGE